MAPRPPSKLVSRLAVAGISIAVVALGALAVWASIVTQNGAKGLSQAGIQTSGHLRAIQALSLIDTSADALEEEIVAAELAKLRNAQRVLDDAFDRMRSGGVRGASEIANESTPVVARMKPVLEQFLGLTPGATEASRAAAEEELEDILGELQVILNDLDSDPSGLLTTELASVTATERAVRATAFVLIPFGLGGVAACAWLLSSYRRRAEATMRAALDATAEEARTDELTGLPNRRALLEVLEQRFADGDGFTLTLADLNGFKRYNDTFGHPAGDALLRRLGGKLATACEGRGIAARLGGDEFCVLLDSRASVDDAHALVHEALKDEGEGFLITCSSGVASVPGEALDPSAALRLADVRMYAAKLGEHPSSDEGMSSALIRMLDERHPGLGSHLEEVTSLAVACAEQLELSADDVRSVERAARLHDIGKVGIPSEILTKEGQLDPEEWEFMRRHSLIGERILAGIPSLEEAAQTVRSSHERWDGEGYPDRLSGDQIPLSARIILVADAYCAMTENRPYASARSAGSARQELLACAGAQFDPAVVTAFLAALAARGASSSPPAPVGASA